MTCIAAIKEKGKVYIGADSAGVGGYNLWLRADEKVFINGSFIMGFTSSFRMGQLLRYNLSVQEQTSTQSDVKYMTTTFIDAVRKCLKDGGYSKIDNNRESGGTFIVGYKGNIYMIENDYQVAMSRYNFEACGCGCDLARGAFHAIRKGKQTPRGKIKTALEAAEAMSAGVRSPFEIMCL